ncbi:hypothetical protein ABZP36_021336 [Zizania latifolia]
MNLTSKLAEVFRIELSKVPSVVDAASGKAAWPELLGRKGGEAKAVVERERPDINGAILVPEDAIVTDDYRCNRVRIFVHCKTDDDYANAVVSAVPKIG